MLNAVQKEKAFTPEDFAKTVVKANRKNDNNVETLSAIDLSKIDDLKSAADNLGKAIINSKDKDAVNNAFKNSEHYVGGELTDAYDFADRLSNTTSDPYLKKKAEDLKNRADSSVIENDNGPDYPNSHGISINVPKNGEADEDYLMTDFAKNSTWLNAAKHIKPS